MENQTLLGAEYQHYYDQLYRNGDQEWLARKWALAANDSVAHMCQLIGNEKFDCLLDVGAGIGSVLEALNGNDVAQRLTAVEISESGLKQIQARHLSKLVDASTFDGYHIPYEANAFDIAISMHVLEHVEHERIFLKELSRVARKIYIEIPLENTRRIKHAIATSGPNGHINFYTPDTALNLFRTSGLKVLKYQIATSSLAYEQLCSGRLKGLVKNRIRRSALALLPNLAPWTFCYLLSAYCEPLEVV